MNSKKCTGIWIASIICFVVFILSFLSLILGSAADASQNYGPGLSLLAGIVVAIIDIVEIVSQSKKADKALIPFIISSFKKENGKDMKRLAWALFFSISPIFILIGVIALCSGVGGAAAAGSAATKASTLTSGAATAGGAAINGNNSTNGTTSNRNTGTYQTINHIAGHTNNDLQQITEAKFNEIQKIAKNNPGLSDEELAKAANVNTATARANRPQLDLSYQELQSISGQTSNDLQQITEAKHNEIQKFAKNNPGLSDEELASAANVNTATARAHRPM